MLSMMLAIAQSRAAGTKLHQWTPTIKDIARVIRCVEHGDKCITCAQEDGRLQTLSPSVTASLDAKELTGSRRSSSPGDAATRHPEEPTFLSLHRLASPGQGDYDHRKWCCAVATPSAAMRPDDANFEGGLWSQALRCVRASARSGGVA